MIEIKEYIEIPLSDFVVIQKALREDSKIAAIKALNSCVSVDRLSGLMQCKDIVEFIMMSSDRLFINCKTVLIPLNAVR